MRKINRVLEKIISEYFDNSYVSGIFILFIRNFFKLYMNISGIIFQSSDFRLWFQQQMYLIDFELKNVCDS